MITSKFKPILITLTIICGLLFINLNANTASASEQECLALQAQVTALTNKQKRLEKTELLNIQKRSQQALLKMVHTERGLNKAARENDRLEKRYQKISKEYYRLARKSVKSNKYLRKVKFRLDNVADKLAGSGVRLGLALGREIAAFEDFAKASRPLSPEFIANQAKLALLKEQSKKYCSA